MNDFICFTSWEKEIIWFITLKDFLEEKYKHNIFLEINPIKVSICAIQNLQEAESLQIILMTNAS